MFSLKTDSHSNNFYEIWIGIFSGAILVHCFFVFLGSTLVISSNKLSISDFKKISEISKTTIQMSDKENHSDQEDEVDQTKEVSTSSKPL